MGGCTVIVDVPWSGGEHMVGHSGVNMSPAEARAIARELLTAADQAEAAERGFILFERLTPREVEVTDLIAAGVDNPAIADRLVIDVRTTEHHVSAIFGKLNILAGRSKRVIVALAMADQNTGDRSA